MSAVWWPKLRERWIDAHARVAGGQRLEHQRGAVAGSVIDEDELEREPLERRAHARMELADRPLLVVDRGDDADQLGTAGAGEGERGVLHQLLILDPRTFSSRSGPRRGGSNSAAG